MGESQEEIISIFKRVEVGGSNDRSNIHDANKSSRGYVPSGDRVAAELAAKQTTHSTKKMAELSSAACTEAYRSTTYVENPEADDVLHDYTACSVDATSIVSKVRERRLLSLRNDVNNLWNAHDAATAHDHSSYTCERAELLSICTVMLDGATELIADSTAEASAVVTDAQAIIDMAIDFTPGLGTAKDVISLVTSTNPLTNENVGDTEKGFIIAGIMVPSILKGTAKSIKKAFIVVEAAIKHNGVAAKAAKTIILYVDKAKNFAKHVTSETTETIPEVKMLLARAADSTGDIIEKTSKQLRSSPGKATFTKKLFDSENILNGTHNNAGIVPLKIADELSGKIFRDFDHFRREFWKSVGRSKYGKQFGSANVETMASGRAPTVHPSQELGKRKTYELHHMTPINKGGSVYDMSNISIVTPKFHKEVLNREYHYELQRNLKP